MIMVFKFVVVTPFLIPISLPTFYKSMGLKSSAPKPKDKFLKIGKKWAILSHRKRETFAQN